MQAVTACARCTTFAAEVALHDADHVRVLNAGAAAVVDNSGHAESAMAFALSRGRKILGISKKQLDAPGNDDHTKCKMEFTDKCRIALCYRSSSQNIFDSSDKMFNRVYAGLGIRDF